MNKYWYYHTGYEGNIEESDYILAKDLRDAWYKLCKEYNSRSYRNSKELFIEFISGSYIPFVHLGSVCLDKEMPLPKKDIQLIKQSGLSYARETAHFIPVA